MFDNVCTLPLPDDVFCLAAHPTRPLVAAGLASGHVHAFRIPPSPAQRRLPFAGDEDDDDDDDDESDDHDDNTSVRSDGRATIETLWRTRRHKGSCRTIAFSPDGECESGRPTMLV
jgi:hypothetical protein